MNDKTYYQCITCTSNPNRPCLLSVNKDEGTPSKCPYAVDSEVKWVEVEIIISTKEK